MIKGRALCVICLLIVLLCGDYDPKVPANSVFYLGREKILLEASGKVVRISKKEFYQIIYLKNVSISYDNQKFHEKKLIIYDPDFNSLQIGNKIHVKGEGSPFEEARNTGNFDVKIHYARQNIYGSVYADQLVLVSDNFNRLLSFLHRKKENIDDCLKSNFTVNQYDFMKAMLIGEKDMTDEELKSVYQRNGISHIFAISGLHISLIGLTIYKFLRKTRIPYLASTLITIFIMSCYVWLTGMSISACRALFMVIIKLFADVTGRKYDVPTALMISGAILIMISPANIMNPSFLFSFVSILGIICITPFVENLIERPFKQVSGLSVSVGVFLVLFPITLFYYFEYSPYTILLNVLLIPLVSVILFLGVAGLLTIQIWPLAGNAFFSLCKILLHFFEWTNRFVNKWPSANIIAGRPKLFLIILYYLSLICFLLLGHYFSKEMKRMKAYFKLIFLGLVVLLSNRFLATDQIEVCFLDVGQGDCIFIKGPEGNTYLIDGGSSDVKQVGKYRIVPFLKCKGVDSLDYIFVTHGDEDHINGIMEIRDEGIEIKNLIFSCLYKQDEKLIKLGTKLKNEGVNVCYMKAGEKIEEHELHITCVGPESGLDSKDSNMSSLVLHMNFHDIDFLFTGDVESEGEKKMVEWLNKYKYDVDILKVAHHGSKNSTTEDFLDKIDGEIAIISAGKNNSYGHPHEETINRLELKHYVLLSTVEHGEIQFIGTEDGVKILTFY